MEEIDVSKIKVIPSDTEIPVYDNHIQTKRPLCTEFPENSTILDRTEAIKIITDISEDLNKSEETCIRNLPIYVEELQAVFDPLNVTECDSDLFKEGKYTTCDSLDELKKLLSELLIKFDTNPEHYIKEDYLYLISVLYKSLIHLYETNTSSVITTEWNDPLRDNWVPSEKLVKETIDSVESQLDEKINQEIEDRQSEISRVDESISDINDLIPSEATSSNQLADKKFVSDQIATNASNFRGDWANWTSVPTDPQYYPEDYTGNKKPNNNDYLIIQNATDYDPSNTGIWRFVYKGDWDTLGKSGWEPQYRVEQAFTPEQLNAINSGITSQKVSNYDNYRQEIDDLFPLIYAGL